MANYIKLVQSQAELTSFKASNDFITPNVIAIYGDTIVDYNPYVAPTPQHDYSLDYFTIEALTSGTLNIEITSYNNEDTKGYLQYSLDGGETWSEEYGSIEDLSLNVNDKILLKGDITIDYGMSGGNSITYTGDFNVYGNIMSLVYGDNFVNQTSLVGKDYIFYSFLAGNETLLSAENLILPATTLADWCYYWMFGGCTSLTTAPVLPATTLTTYCYAGMFSDCANLNSITCLATDISALDCTSGWVYNVAFNGTFIKANSMTDWTTGEDGIPDWWIVYTDQESIPTPTPTPSRNYSQEYFTIETLESGTLEIYCAGNGSVSYSLNNGNTWTTASGHIENLTVRRNTSILLKGDLVAASQYSGGNSINFTGQYNVCGNIMSLIYGDNFINQTSLNGYEYIFEELLYQEFIINAENLILPATTLASNCYRNMFNGCALLTTTPELPATTLADYCYDGMFNDCESITSIPTLPATTLANGCYSNMFSYCTSLTTVPSDLLPATTLESGCYAYMFMGCNSLTNAPDLLATTLESTCYKEMFYGCSSLSYIKCMATDITEDECVDDWVYGVANSGTFIKDPNMTNWDYWNASTSGIPDGWTVQNAS